MKKWWILGIVAVVVTLVVVNMVKSGGKAVEVEKAQVVRKDLTEAISASGTLTPKSKVDVSANAMGRITGLFVAEGDTVHEGDVLLEIDPTEYASAVHSYEAAVQTMEADLRLSEANADKAGMDYERAESLHDSGLSSDEQLQAANTALSVNEAGVAASHARLRQARANLDKAKHDLSKVTITAPMTGVVTRLNVEAGENAVMGTLNVAGTVLLQIADLSTMEAEVDVDETEVVRVALGQHVDVSVDAFPDTTFAGIVTEIGNSPIYTSTGQNRQAVDFKVTITLVDRVVGVRQGLSAKADIRVASSTDALTVPIGCVTIREWPHRERTKNRRPRRNRTADDDSTGVEREDKEGVFVIEEGVVRFAPVTLGITGEDDFEIVTGVEEGWTIVTGPFRSLRDLQHGDEVAVSDDGQEKEE